MRRNVVHAITLLVPVACGALPLPGLAPRPAAAQGPAPEQRQQAPVSLVAQDASGRPYRLEADRGQVVAVVTLSRYTTQEASPVQDALGTVVQPGQVVALSVIDLIGIPGIFQGMARRKVVEGTRKSPLRYLVDDHGVWRQALGVQPDRRVDILVLDRGGVLRGHFVGKEQIGAALQLIRALRDQPAGASRPIRFNVG